VSRSFVEASAAKLKEFTTNRPTEDWGQLLGDVPATTAIPDRFLAHADVVKMQGKSYRLHQRAQRNRNKDDD
jgi:DNA replication protein DnaC